MCLPAIPVALAAASTAAASTGGLVAAASIPAAGAAAAAAATATGFSAVAAGGLSLGTLATGASLLSGAVGSYGAYQQGQQNSAMNKYQANILQQQQVLNQRSADANKTIVSEQGAEQSKSLARKLSVVKGAQEAVAAANGTAGSVTSNDIALDTFDTGKLDQLAVQYNANLKTWGIDEGLHGENWQLGVESDRLNIAASNARRAGYINAGTSLLSTASQVTNNKLLLNTYGRGAIV